MPAEPATVFPIPVQAASAARGDFSSQRGSREIGLEPKYGQGACRVAVRYLWTGAPGAPTVIVQGGISASRDVCASPGHANGWWSELVGEGAAIDLSRCRVLSIEWLVPSDLTGASAVSSDDQADALAALVDDLGIGRVLAFVGASYGAMTGLAFAARHPGPSPAPAGHGAAFRAARYRAPGA
jgi:homoserine O-acetyltransferase